MKFALICTLLTCLSFLASCEKNPSGLSKSEMEEYKNTEWTKEELGLGIAVRNISRTENYSTHLIRLMGKEYPHYHDSHDLNIQVISGSSALHYETSSIRLKPGDSVLIPRGTYHWAENVGINASVVFVTFTPPFDGKDRRPSQ